MRNFYNMNYHSTYKNHNIYRDNNVGYYMRWSAYCEARFFYADTLKGIKKLITENL
jgi:hypothetical protein